MCCDNYERKWFQQALQSKELVEKLKKINLIITDIDGCLTDGKVFYSADDDIQKNFSIQDGYMITKCNKPDMPHIAFVTGRSDKATTKRAHVLGIPDDLYYQGISQHKSDSVQEIQKRVSATQEETLFFGDDLLDIGTRDIVGLFASPQNALFYIHDNSDIILPRVGGDGAFRILLDLILFVQQKHIAQDLLEKSLRTSLWKNKNF